MIRDLWGQVIARASDGSAIAITHLDHARDQDVRRLISMAFHRGIIFRMRARRRTEFIG